MPESFPPPFRIKTITPRKVHEYTHKYFVVVYLTGEGLLVIDENTGEVFDSPADLYTLIKELTTQRIFLVNEAGWFTQFLHEHFKDHPQFQLKGIEYSTKIDKGYAFTTTLSAFGFIPREGERRIGMHKVWSITDFPEQENLSATEFLKYASDVRSYFEDRNEAIPSRGNKGLAAWFAKHPDFWPNARGRVPKFVNEAIRNYLPGNYNALLYMTQTPVDVWAVDMRSAYHVAARQVQVPNWDDMYARGYSRNWEVSPIWFKSDTKEYRREIARYGAFVLDVTPTYNVYRWTLPVVESGRKRIVVWSNEVWFLESQGIQINGIVAAWSSAECDTGLSRYASFAEKEIQAADKFRKKWLKPSFHSLYGMLAARPRKMSIGHLQGNSDTRPFIFPGGTTIDLHTYDLETKQGKPIPYELTHTAILGMLSAEIRIQMMLTAIDLERKGYEVTHMHADAVHVRIKPDLSLPFSVVGKEWKVQKLIDLVYLNDVQWIWKGGKTLPGVPAREAMKYEVAYRDTVTSFDWNNSRTVSYEEFSHDRDNVFLGHRDIEVGPYQAEPKPDIGRAVSRLSGRRRSA